MSQPRALSALEAVANVAAGLGLAFAVQVVAFPLIGMTATLSQNAALAAIFTAFSLARSYAIRRLFNRMDRAR